MRFAGSKFESNCLAVHQKAITDIKLGYNNEHLITASENGSIYFSTIKEMCYGKNMTMGDIFSAIGDKNEVENIGKISNTFNLNEFALLSSKLEIVRK